MSDRIEHARSVNRVWSSAAPGEEADLAAAWTEGREMGLEQAIALATRETVGPPGADRPNR